MIEDKEINIGEIANWILTIALIIAVVYAGYMGLVKPCNCYADLGTVCAQYTGGNLSWLLK
jgi:hypothetical protein